MRILQLVPRYAPAWTFGGGVRISYDLAQQWVGAGHDVSVFTSDQRDTRRRFDRLEEDLDGIHVRRFRNPSASLAGRYPFLFWRPKGMRAALEASGGRFDVVHVMEARGPHNRWAASAAGKAKVPIVWSAYGGLAPGIGARAVYRVLHDAVSDTRGIVRAATALIATTSHEAEVFRSFGADRTRIRQIPLAVNWSEFETLPPRGAFRAELGLRDDQRLVLFLGRIHMAKGLQVLIPAFAEVARRCADVHLAVVGWDYGYLVTARKMAGELGLGGRISFHDGRPGSARLQVYRDADLFALTPGIYEETTLTSLESCACGTACLVTHQCEIPGLDAADAGRTVTYDVGKVAAAMRSILEGRAERRMGAAARILARTSFSTDVVARQHIELFEEVCGSAPMRAATATSVQTSGSTGDLRMRQAP